MKYKYTAVSLFSGAGGMDVGFANAGFNILCANDIDADSCETYQLNSTGTVVINGDLCDHLQDLENFKGVDVIFGGPPCQGFSVAGKMNPADPRSSLLLKFLEVVERLQPKLFVCENVKALATLQKWSHVREEFHRIAYKAGYDCEYIVLNASNFGVPQVRERVFFIGAKKGNLPPLQKFFRALERKSPTIRETIAHLGRAGTQFNSRVCHAKITLAANPVMRRSPYAGMLFNGLGRPVKLAGYSATLPASMGGNKTPIVDEEELHGGKSSWVEQYHKNLLEGKKPEFTQAPSRLRRMTIDEAALIQTFPKNYVFAGRKSSIFRQIGNAVPCKLAQAVGTVVLGILNGEQPATKDSDICSQLAMFT